MNTRTKRILVIVSVLVVLGCIIGGTIYLIGKNGGGGNGGGGDKCTSCLNSSKCNGKKLQDCGGKDCVWFPPMSNKAAKCINANCPSCCTDVVEYSTEKVQRLISCLQSKKQCTEEGGSSEDIVNMWCSEDNDCKTGKCESIPSIPQNKGPCKPSLCNTHVTSKTCVSTSKNNCKWLSAGAGASPDSPAMCIEIAGNSACCGDGIDLEKIFGCQGPSSVG